MRGTVTASVAQEQHFLCFGQGDDQRMIAPLAFAIDADTLLLLAVGFYHRAIGFNCCHVEESVILLFPNLPAGTIDPLHDFEQLQAAETSAKITCRRRIGNSLGTESIQIRFIIAALLQVFQTSPTGQ